MKKNLLTLIVFFTFLLCPITHAAEQIEAPKIPEEFKELESFLNEYVWVAIDNSKIELPENQRFFPYSKDRDIYYRGYLRVIGKKGIIIERGMTKKEEELELNFKEEETWIPWQSILSIGKNIK